MNTPPLNLPGRRRLASLVLIGTLLCLPLIGYGVHRTVKSNCNDVRQWLPNGIVETQEYDQFVEQFGSDEIVVVSWPGCDLDDSRIDLVSTALARWTSSDAEDSSADQPGYFKNIITGPGLLAELTGPPLRLKRSTATARLSGTLIGTDGTSTGLLLEISEFGAANRHAAMETIYDTVESAANISRSQIHIGGQTADSVALDIESQRSRLKLTGMSVVAAFVLAWCCLRQLRLVLAVAATALVCAATSLSLVYFTGGTTCLLLVTMQTLTYVLAVSAAIQLTPYYLDAIETG
ncbi:MAG: MMPL family transporter, partial [Bythopirellula sp.]